MSSPHRIFGAEMSPYSVKVRSYFRYKGIPQQWIVRNMETQAEYQKYAKLPIVPLVVTSGALIEGRAQRVLDWVHRMLWPRAEGDFEAWSSLEPTLLPFLERQVGRLFLPWSVANAAAIAAGKEEFRVELDGRGWSQKPQKYHAKSLAALRAKYVAARGVSGLEAILERAGCLAGLRREGEGA
jgi:hypothetical protein